MDGIMMQEQIREMMNKEKSLLSDIENYLKESESVWNDTFPVIKEDFEFYIGNQWDAKDKRAVEKKGAPALSLNYLKKNVDVLSGFQRQNRSDIKVLPVEGSDELIAEVLTEVTKWVTNDQVSEFVISDAFKDSLICGIGWIVPVISYEDDMLNGDILLKKLSPYKVFLDPYTTERDLSDCSYIIVKDTKSKAMLKGMFPKFADKIEKLQPIDPSIVDNANNVEQTPSIANRKSEKLRIVEYWRREWEEVTLISSGEEIVVAKDDEEIAIAKADPNLEVITKKVPKIKLTQVIGESLIVFDGDNPHKTKGYPFHPIFCFFTNTMDRWEDRIQGIIRALKDPQREKNKRRSQIMQAVNTSVHSGWIMDNNAVDDVNVLRNSAGAGKVIVKNAGKELSQITPPQIPSSIIQLEMMFKDDMLQIGSNPDMLGMMQEKGAAGVTIQLRQKQGMTSMQEPFDNLSFAIRNIGKQIIEIVTSEWNVAKVKRILGNNLPFDEEKELIQEQMEILSKQMQEVPEHNVVPLPEPTTPDELEMAQKQVMNDEDSLAGQEQMKMMQQKQAEDLQSEMDDVLKREEEFWNKYEEVKKTARFDCVVSEAASSPSQRMANFMLLNEMGRNGTPVPPELLIELSDLPEETKEKFIQFIQSQGQQPAK
jgi:hypothetical protein